MEPVFYETLASGDILVDVNGTPLLLDLDLPDSGSGGGSSQWKDPVFWPGDLPNTGNTSGDVRFVIGESAFYAWTGNEWTPAGSVTNLSSFWKDPVWAIDDLPTMDNDDGDARLVRQVRRIYTWESGEWKALTDLVGSGSGGISSVEYYADLEAVPDPQVGDMYLVKDENAIYVWDEVIVDKEPVQSWQMLNAKSKVELKLGEKFPWLQPDGEAAGYFQIRAQSAQQSLDMQTDPALVTEGYGGLVYYPPTGSSVGGYEPARTEPNWDRQYIRRETREFLAYRAWRVEAHGLIEFDFVADGLYSLAVTLGRPGWEGNNSTLYGEIDRENNLLRFGRVSGQYQSMFYDDLESVPFQSPPANSEFRMWMERKDSVITLHATVYLADGSEYEATVTHSVRQGTDYWMEPDEGLYLGFGSRFGDAQNKHVFTYASFSAEDAWRELVFTMKSAAASASSPELDLILADTRTGWLVGGGGSGGGDGSPHVIQTAQGNPLPQREAIRPVTPADDDLVALYVQDDPAGDATRFGISIDPSVFQKKVDAQVIKTQGSKTGFKSLALKNGFGHPALEDEEGVAGWRYTASYQYDGGWVIFRGVFESTVEGPAVIGQLDEDFCPPHPVMGVAVRDDGGLAALRIEADGNISVSNVRAGFNYLDGVRFYTGKGFLAIVGTFIPDPNNPYYAVVVPDGQAKSVVLKGAGIFEYPRDSDRGTIELPSFPTHTDGYQGWTHAGNAYVQWVVIDGPDQGLSGTINFGGSPGDAQSITVEIPPGLDGQVRVTFVNFIWYEYYVT